MLLATTHKISLNLTLPLDLPCYFRTFLYPSANVVFHYGLWYVIGFILHQFIPHTHAHIHQKKHFVGLVTLRAYREGSHQAPFSFSAVACLFLSFPTGQINFF